MARRWEVFLEETMNTLEAESGKLVQSVAGDG
jgi:hypothetical protein